LKNQYEQKRANQDKLGNNNKDNSFAASFWNNLLVLPEAVYSQTNAMNKRAQLVEVIGLLIAFAAIVYFLWDPITAAMKGAGSTVQCDISLLLSFIAKTATLGAAEIPPGCEAEQNTLGEKEISYLRSFAVQRIKAYHSDPAYYGAAASAFPTDSQGRPTKEAIDEWVLDNFMADKVANCWKKVWFGKLDVFKRNIVPTSRNICVVCNVITFPDDMPISWKNKGIANPVKSLEAYMKAEGYGKTNYYNFIEEGQIPPPTPQAYTFPIIKTRQTAVTYMETKVDTFLSGYNIVRNIPGASFTTAGAMLNLYAYARKHTSAITGKAEDMKQLFIVPFDELEWVCTDLVG